MSRTRRAAPVIVGGPILSGEPVPLASVLRNPRNPRTEFRDVESFARVGQLNSIKVVRRGDSFLIVEGERRHRTAEKLGWSHIGIEIVDLTDEQIEIAMLAFGRDGDPLSALDDASAIARLSTEHAWNATELSIRIGRNETDVRRALALAALHDDLKAIVRAGPLLASDALVYARLSAQDQARAAKMLADSEYVASGERIPSKFVRTHVKRWLLSLADPGFDTAECATCPRRTGNQTMLAGLAEVGADDRCTDAACFAAKRDRRWAELREKHPDAAALEGQEARRAIGGQGYRPATAGERPGALARDDDGRAHALVAVAPAPAPAKRPATAPATTPAPTAPKSGAGLSTADRNALLDRCVDSPSIVALIAGLERLARPEWLREIRDRRGVDSLVAAARSDTDSALGIAIEIAGMLSDDALRAIAAETPTDDAS